LTDSEELAGVVLSREPAGERFLRIHIFDQTSGLRVALFPRHLKKAAKAPPPDLFDDIQCLLHQQPSANSIPFVRDFEKIHTFRNLATQPSLFLTAGEMARFYLTNGSHLLDPAPQLKLLRTSLEALGRASVPKVVLIKLYFCFARNEGLPVRESWLAGLPEDRGESALLILKQHVDQIRVEPERINQILLSIQMWMNAETELQV